MSDPVGAIEPAVPPTLSVAETDAPTKRAVIYPRVASAQQHDGDGRGMKSYPMLAQRQACQRKARELGAEVIHEYGDVGESGLTADRPEFQRMLARIRIERDVDYVIVESIDRLARDHRVYTSTLAVLRSNGAKLASARENVDDETTANQLLYAMSAGIAGSCSRNRATEVRAARDVSGEETQATRSPHVRKEA
jgi:DNA invertase Pin-like site-specific DNA recombinase